MYKIAVLGDRDSIYGFATLGLDTYPVSNPTAGAETLRKLAADNYAVIYITENLMQEIGDVIDEYKEERLPAIIGIPGVLGNTGVCQENLKKLVLQAVGSDII